MVKQNIVFVENKAGSLKRVTGMLADNDINIYGFACFDAPEFAIFRMICDNPDKAEMILNFLMRGMAGMLMLYFANHYLESYLPQLKPGYNWLTFALCGLLGLPGVLLIYGILFFLQMLS